MKNSNENYEVENPEIEQVLKEIGKMIGSKLPKTHGFTLMIFDFGQKGELFYISNARRNDMIKSLMEFIAKLQESKIN